MVVLLLLHELAHRACVAAAELANEALGLAEDAGADVLGEHGYHVLDEGDQLAGLDVNKILLFENLYNTLSLTFPYTCILTCIE